MTIPPKYEDVVAKLDAAEVIIQAGEHVESHLENQIDILRIDLDSAMGREAALREELANKCEIIQEFRTSEEALRDSLGRARHRRDDVIDELDTLQQRLTVAEQRCGYLEGFSKEMIDAAFEGGSLDGAEIQDIAVKHGLLKIENRTEECGDVCACREFGFPSECYRKTDLSALKPAEGEGS